MSLSDCANCWETPCICGYDYRHSSKKYIEELRSVLLKVKKIQSMTPDLTDEEWKKKLNELNK